MKAKKTKLVAVKAAPDARKSAPPPPRKPNPTRAKLVAALKKLHPMD